MPARRIGASARQWVGVAVVGLVTALGAFWFWLVEGFSLINAVYQSVITVSTVGFAEVETLDTSGRLFTIVLITVGVAAMVYALGGFAEMLIESSMRRYQYRRKEKTLERMTGHTIICGYGRIGAAVVSMLPDTTKIGIIEVDAERAEAATLDGLIAVEADATEDETLTAAGIERAAKIIVCLSNDSDAISTVLSARVLNPSIHIVTRVNTASAARKLRLAGADHVVSPIQMGAQRLVADAMEPTIGSFLDAALTDTAVGLSIRAISVQRQMEQSEIKQFERESGARVLGIQNASGEMISSDEKIEAGQICVVVGHRAELVDFERQLA